MFARAPKINQIEQSKSACAAALVLIIAYLRADGKQIAATIRAEIKTEVEKLRKEHNTTPGLAVVLVGNRPDSATYVRMKKKAAAEVAFHSVDIELEETVSEADLLAEVEKLNADPKVHGILVQLPLPKHINEALVLKSIKVEKESIREREAAIKLSGLLTSAAPCCSKFERRVEGAVVERAPQG